MGVKVKQRKGKWWVHLCHQGMRRARSFADKKAAVEFGRQVEGALARGEWLGKDDEADAAKPTFRAFCEQFLNRAEAQLKHSTLRSYESISRVHLLPVFGERRLADLRRRDINDFEAALRAQGMANGTLTKITRVLSSILSEAAEDELLPENPALNRRKRRRRTSAGSAGDARRPDPFTREETERLLKTALDHVEPRRGQSVAPFRAHYPFLLLLARTGVRLGEAIALRWGDVDLTAGTLQVRRSFARGRFDAPKSGRARVVYLSSQLKGTLRELYEARFGKVIAFDGQAEAERRGARLEALVFPGETGEPMDESYLRRRVWLPLLAAAGLRHARLHDLRHGYASLLLAQGAELMFVSQQLGHATAAFTLRVYAHLLPADRRAYVDLLDDASARKPGATSEVHADQAPAVEVVKTLAANGS